MTLPNDPTKWDEYRKKISVARTGKKMPESARQKLSQDRTCEKQKLSKLRGGENNPFFGKQHNMETRKHLSQIRRGHVVSDEVRQKISASKRGISHSKESVEKMRVAMIGKTHTMESRLKMSESRRGDKNVSKRQEVRQKISQSKMGEKNPSWAGGVSFEPYCLKFNNEFKRRVRGFFNNTCVNCGRIKEEHGKNLHVHHVNFNKNTCCDDTPPIFVTLCGSCHAKTQQNRDEWRKKFTELVNLRYGGKCYLPREVGLK